METNAIRFTGANGVELSARLDGAAERPRAFALFAHCFTCSKDSFAATYISRALAAAGIAVLRFDFTGLGNSGGDFANTNFSSNIADLVAAANFLSEHYAAPKILVGHSLGGAAVLAAAERMPQAVAVATIGAPLQPAHIRHLLAPTVAEIESKGEAEVVLAGRKFRIKRQFLDDIASHNTRDGIANLRKALLVLHSPRDTTVSIENAGEIFTAAKHPKSFVSLDNADHLLTRKADANYVANVLAAWVDRYLPVSEANPEADFAAEAGTVAVQETGLGKFAQMIWAGKHALRADEPIAFGGNDSGPAPYELLLASLGACTAMTLRLYANQKQIPLDKVTVRLRHEKIHAQDCAECETKDGKIDKISREIELAGVLDAGQRAKLLEIANKCPVHRTLLSKVYVPTTVLPPTGI